MIQLKTLKNRWPDQASQITVLQLKEFSKTRKMINIGEKLALIRSKSAKEHSDSLLISTNGLRSRKIQSESSNQWKLYSSILKEKNLLKMLTQMIELNSLSTNQLKNQTAISLEPLMVLDNSKKLWSLKNQAKLSKRNLFSSNSLSQLRTFSM